MASYHPRLCLETCTVAILMSALAPAQETESALPVELRARARFAVGRGVFGAMALHPQHKMLVTGGVQGDLQLHTRPGGMVRWVKLASDHWFRAARFSPDGQHIAASARTLTVWTLGGKKVREWPTGGTIPVGVAWSPDSGRLAFGDADGEGVTVVETRKWGIERHFAGLAKWPVHLVFSGDGRRVFAGMDTGLTWQLDLLSGAAARVAPDRTAGVVHVQLHGDRLLRGYEDGLVLWGDVRVAHGDRLYAAAAHGDRIVTAGPGHVRAWNGRGEKTGELALGAGALEFGADGDTVLIASRDGRLLRWDFRDVEELSSGHPSRVEFLTFSRDSGHVVAADADGRSIIRCEVRSGVTRECAAGLPLGPGPADAELITREAKGLAVRDAGSWKLLRRIPAAPFFVDHCDERQLAPDGRTLLLGDRFFDITTGRSTVVDHAVSNIEATWSRNGHVAVHYGIGIDGGSGIRIFGPARQLAFEKEYPSTAGWLTAWVTSHDFAPSGRFLIYIEQNRYGPSRLCRIDMRTMQVVDAKDASLRWWRYLDEGLALALTDEGMELWDAKTRCRLGALDGALGDARRLVLSPDRRWLAAAFALDVRLFAIDRER